MKKNILMIIAILALGIMPKQSKAQTAIQIYGMVDSLGVHCITPANSGINLDAYAFGYPNGTVFSIYIDFGDGSDTTFNVNSWGGATQYINAYPLHTYQFPGNYTVSAIVTGPDLNTDQLTGVDMVIVSNTCENVTGKLYFDENASCSVDPSEHLFRHVKVELYSGSSLLETFYTDINGEFSFDAPTGMSYSLNVDGSYWLYPSGFVESCSNTGSVSFTLSSPLNFEFPYACNTNGFDLVASHIPGYGFVPGLIGYIKPIFYNYSCQPQSGTVDITLDPQVTFVTNTGTPPNSINGNVLTWNFTAIDNTNGYSALNSLVGQVIFETATTAQIGDQLCFGTQISPVTGDFNAANNQNNKCYYVVASFDPNMKEVFPAGTGPEGFVDPDLTMTYTVHFQNTGTAAAQNIFILDTLDADLDFSTLQILNASHEMNLYITPDGILKFDFPDIQLPDSNSNEPLSHGHVIYQLAQKPALQPGTEIRNTAHIFFDYNDAVVTNTTLNTIATPEEINEWKDDAITVFPNPSDGMLQIQGVNDSYFNYFITDLAGKMVLEGKLQENSLIDLSALNSGIYILAIGGEKTVKKKIEIIR